MISLVDEFDICFACTMSPKHSACFRIEGEPEMRNARDLNTIYESSKNSR